MKLRIRTIFLIPVFGLMILFPIVAYVTFHVTANNYMQSLAKSELRHTLDTVLPIAQMTLVDIDESLPEEEILLMRKEQVRDFLKQVRAILRRDNTLSQLLVLGRDLDLNYPEEGELYEGLKEVQMYYQTMLRNSKDSVTFDAIDTISINEREFITYAIELKITEKSSRYLIAYSPMEDITEMLFASGRLILYITFAIALVVTIILVIVSKGISRPIEKLCYHTRQISNGSISKISEQSRVVEIVSLTREMNKMSERLRQSEEEQRTFYENIAHELRTPLMSIRGYAEGIACGTFADNREAGNIIVAQSMRLNDLAGELMTLSELENMDRAQELIQIPLGEFLTDLVRLTEGLAMQKGIAVNIHLESESRFEVWADEELLGKVGDNLLSNAIRYAKTRVDINVFEDNNNVHIRVSDDGEGITPEDMDNIFKRFYKGKGGSTGLGLSIVRAAATAMGGTVSAWNSDEGGAVFDVALRSCSRKDK